MRTFRLDHLLDFVTSTELLVMVLWVGLATLTVTLLVLMRTRWGQARPLRKCLGLSLLAHVLLAGYATTVQIVASNPFETQEPVVRVSVDEGDSEPENDLQNPMPREKPWESFVHPQVVQPSPVELARAEPAEIRQPRRQSRSEQSVLAANTPFDRLPLAEAVQPEPEDLPTEASGPTPSTGKSAEPIEAPAPQRREAVRTEVPGQPQLAPRPQVLASSSQPIRNHRAGLPSALLERPLPMPRMADVPTTPDPQRTLTAVTDSVWPTPRGRPAEWSASPPPKTGSAPEMAPGPGTRLSPPQANHLRPPAIARGGGSDQIDPGEAAAIDRSVSGTTRPLIPVNRRDRTERELPSVYRLRVAPDRFRLAQRNGATVETEAAVKAALKWMADNQGPDGRWNSKTHGGGRELLVAGRDRQAAGMRADTGMTGLALLAFLAAGNTHQEGLYRDNVRRGLQFLLNSQAPDGNLGGQATTYAFLYSHAMAAFALSEAYGMTGDQHLREPVRRAVAYTVAAQDPSGGGWRYKPGDPGDTSQLGWQLMVLKSAELAGIPIPQRTEQGAIRYLNSVSSGNSWGFAAYRPGEPPSRPMTAEALASRQFLGMSPDHPAGKEAGDYLLGELPGEARTNLYYWYYGTLGMYQLQGTHWERWNEALKKTLVHTQQKTGSLAGSWDPDTVWGGYGGRIYSTALAALCLEVYYRFLPIYAQTASQDSRGGS